MALEASGVGVFEHDGDGSHFDARWAEILGLDPPVDEPYPDWLRSRLHADDSIEYERAHEAMISGRTDRLEGDWRLWHGKGHYVPVRVSLKAFERGASERDLHVVGVLTDLTDRWRMETELRQAHKMGSQAASPTTQQPPHRDPRLGFGGLAVESGTLPSGAAGDVEEMLKAAARAQELTAHLLAFSGVEEERRRIER